MSCLSVTLTLKDGWQWNFLCIMLLDKLEQNQGHYGFVKIGSENFYVYHNCSEVDRTQIMATLEKSWDVNGELCMLSCKLNILEWGLRQLYCNEGSVFLLRQYSKMNNNLNMTKNEKVKLYTKNRVYIMEQYDWYIKKCENYCNNPPPS